MSLRSTLSSTAMQDTQFAQLALTVRCTVVNTFSTNEDEHSTVHASTPRSVVITCSPTHETAAKHRVLCIIWTDGNSIVEDEVFPLEETSVRECFEIALDATAQLAYFDRCVLVVIVGIIGDGLRTGDERIEVCGRTLATDTSCAIHEHFLLPPRACGTQRRHCFTERSGQFTERTQLYD